MKRSQFYGFGGYHIAVLLFVRLLNICLTIFPAEEKRELVDGNDIF
jgi:hypothetical protein